MKKGMDKLSKFFNLSKHTLIFLLGLLAIGIICGSLFNVIISKSDQVIVNDYLANFFNKITNNELNFMNCFKDSLVFNYLYVLFIWILGISIIGLPIILFMFFGKAFTLGFTIAAIIKHYGVKGCLISLAYVFPHYIVNVFVFTVLTIYALSLSIRMIKCIVKRKTIDFRPIMKKYTFILIGCLIVILITSLYEALIMPNILKYILTIVK